jgi:outer membrane lipoprotein-sorting protein
MHPISKLTNGLIVLLLGFALLVTAAEAYVPHGLHLLELMTKEMGTTDSLQVSQKLIVRAGELEGEGEESIELTETLMYAFPDGFRSEISSQNAERIHVVFKGKSVTIIDKKVVAESESEFDRYKDIFLYNSRALLEIRLPQIGVDPSISSVGRFQGRIGYVLGAQYPDESTAQLWLDKNTFRPFRWLVKPGAFEDSAAMLEIRFYGWRQVGSIWYPVRIEFYQSDQLVRIIQVENLKINPKLSGRLFDIRRLKLTYPKGGQLLPDQPDAGEQSEVQQTLERFQKIFE